MKRKDLLTVLLVALLAGVFGFGLVTFLVAEKKPAESVLTAQTAPSTAQTPAAQAAENANTQARTPQPAPTDDSFFTTVFGSDQAIPGHDRNESWTTVVPRIIVRLMLAALLAAVLAFRPRKDAPLLQRNLYVAQTQILLAVVASALMMIVGDNAARAFGIFAAVSLVRFRTNIRDPKEITVLLISLSLGLATGVGRWDLAVILGLFVLPLLWLLEARESEQVYRAMQLTVKTQNTDAMQQTLQRIFKRHKFNAELRQLNPPDENEPVGCIMYYVNMNLSTSTDQISEEIRTQHEQEIESIEWEQKKDGAYIYQ